MSEEADVSSNQTENAATRPYRQTREGLVVSDTRV